MAIVKKKKIEDDYKIVIEDGVVKLCKTEIAKTYSLQDFYNIASKFSKSDFGLLPKNCRYSGKIGNKSLIITEESPKIRTINVVNEKGEIEKFTISLPWIIYAFLKSGNKINQFFIFAAKHHITSLNNFLYKLPTNNINNGTVCLGNTNMYKMKPDTIIKDFWQTNFNQDYTPEWFKKKKAPITSYKNWENKTKKNSSFILRTRFQKVKTIQEFINEFLNKRREVRNAITGDVRGSLDTFLDTTSSSTTTNFTTTSSNVGLYFPEGTETLTVATRTYNA